MSPDGRRVVFLRSESGSDPVTALWVLDRRRGEPAEERLVAEPHVLLAHGGHGDGSDDDGDLPDAERARRERAREAAGGITSYATDDDVTVVAFALNGRLFVGGLVSGSARELDVPGPVFDPRPDPGARRLAYVCGRTLRVAELDGSTRVVAGGDDDPPTVSWGAADFIAAEEMGRHRGYWWSPDGDQLAVCRVDEGPVQEWVVADPANPDRPARTIRYPAAGTDNAVVTLHLVDLEGHSRDVEWDRETYPYLCSVAWSDAGLVAVVQSRDQRATAVVQVDPTTGDTSVLAHDHDDAWVELVAGVPRLLPDGRLLTAADRDGARRLLIDGDPVTPPHLQVRSVVTADAEQIVFLANHLDDATELHVWRRTADGETTALTDEPGVHQASASGAVVVITSATLADAETQTWVLDHTDGERSAPATIRSLAERPVIEPNVELLTLGDDRLAAALLLPHDHDGSPLPVLLDPYGGPHALRVTRQSSSLLVSQWFAEQGFAVLVADGRGTPGRGSAWERAVHHDLATAPLDDQVTALHAAAAHSDALDLDRVAIRGWSFGGYLAALAVLRRPDVFHAAIAGAPVTEWRLYDTHYTERYLGDPGRHPEAYDASSLLPLAAQLERPLLLVHGLADDNVFAAHTLQLSAALLAAGRPHEVLPLAGVTHMTPQEVVAENLLLHQLDFLRRALSITSHHSGETADEGAGADSADPTDPTDAPPRPPESDT